MAPGPSFFETVGTRNVMKGFQPLDHEDPPEEPYPPEQDPYEPLLIDRQIPTYAGRGATIGNIVPITHHALIHRRA